MKPTALLACLVAALPAAAQSLEVRTEGPFRWVCGGVGAEERRALAQVKPQSNVEILFVTARRGGYLSGAELTVRAEGATLPALRLRADGPYCYLDAPAGAYRLDAQLGNLRREQRVKVPAGAASPTRVVFTFPGDPDDDIRATEEEKRQARAP